MGKEEIIKRKEEIKSKLAELGSIINEEELTAKIHKIQEEMTHPQFWENQKSSTQKIQELKKIRSLLEPFQALKKDVEDLEEFIQISDSEQELMEEMEIISKKMESLKMKLILKGEFDANNAILSINSGAGGVDACDWANMLLRMYTRWAQNKGFEFKILDILYSEEAGIKNAVVYIKGLYAYGYLKSETGVHRLVRISPFDANRRRHTSFASVEVIPEIEEEINIQIKPEDLKIETFRASGPGGQHVNVTDSAVRITHLPTGIVVQCQNERSQYQNKQVALKILKSRLYELERSKLKEKIKSLNPQKMSIQWGSQIRSYILHPYTLVKDHRTDKEIYNVQEVLDGNIDPFIEAYLVKFG